MGSDLSGLFLHSLLPWAAGAFGYLFSLALGRHRSPHQVIAGLRGRQGEHGFLAWTRGVTAQSSASPAGPAARPGVTKVGTHHLHIEEQCSQCRHTAHHTAASEGLSFVLCFACLAGHEVWCLDRLPPWCAWLGPEGLHTGLEGSVSHILCVLGS